MTEFRIIRSDRRTLALQVKDGEVLVRAPRRVTEAQIQAFVAAHEAWIASTLEKQQRRAALHPEPTQAERAAYIQKAKAILPERVAPSSRIMGLSPQRTYLLFLAADAVPAGGNRLCRRP